MSEEKTEKTADELLEEIQAAAEVESMVVEETVKPAEPTPAETPETPEVPDTPETTETPETPEDAKDTPEVPEAPEATEATDVEPETAEEPPAAEAEVPEDKPKHPAQLRIANRELREEVERLKQAQATQASPTAPTTDQPIQGTPVPQEQKAEPLQVFAALMKAENDGYANETDSAMVKKQAMDILQNDFSVQEIDAMLATGLNVFGEEGRDIAAQIQSNVRPQVAMREMQSQQQLQADKAEHDRALQAVRADFPDLMNADSDASKALQQWDEVHLGKADATGRIVSRGALSDADVRYIQANPYLHATLAMGVHDSPQVQAVSSELEAMKKQLSEAKEKLALLESPEGPSGSRPASTRNKEITADDLYQKMLEKSNVG